MIQLISCVIFFIFLKIFSAEEVENAFVTIPDGTLKGKIMYDRYNNEFYGFQSIPYAEPPIGNLRFKDPLPNKPWNGTRDATHDLPECYQSGTGLLPIGQEDCLYLNVYSSSLTHVFLRPVMVYIHGGAFTIGSGRQDIYSPEFLIPEDIVLVTINYRLNVFGFFSLDDASLGTPGNAGLKDQRLALEWVQKNIMYFGGNPNRVTIFGQSAGGVSVHLHVLSPLSEGLFSRAILQSGVALAPWLVGIPNVGQLLAETLQISTNDTANMLATLQSLPALSVFSAFQLLTLRNPMRWGGPHMPIIEKQTDGSAFFIDNPLKLIREGNYNKVPLLIGYTDAEGIFFEQLIRSVAGQAMPVTDFFAFVPDELGILPGTPEALQLAQELKIFYQGESEPSPDNMQPFIDVNTDSWFRFPARRAAVEHAKNNHYPVYFYRFSADTKLNIFKNRDQISASYKGAGHTDDVTYMFKTFFTPDIVENSIEDKAIDRVVKIWTNFATHAHPQAIRKHDWKPVDDDVVNYMDIGSTQDVSGVNPDDENMRFWLAIFERYGIL